MQYTYNTYRTSTIIWCRYRNGQMCTYLDMYMVCMHRYTKYTMSNRICVCICLHIYGHTHIRFWDRRIVIHNDFVNPGLDTSTASTIDARGCHFNIAEHKRPINVLSNHWQINYYRTWLQDGDRRGEEGGQARQPRSSKASRDHAGTTSLK